MTSVSRTAGRPTGVATWPVVETNSVEPITVEPMFVATA